MTEHPAISRGFAVLRLVLDPRGINTIPAGVVAWDESRNWYQIRAVAEGERVRFLPRHLVVLLETAIAKMRRWAESGQVPGNRSEISPASGAFWEAVRTRLVSGVRLDQARALEPSPNLDLGIEALFDAIVQPTRQASAQRHRIEGVVREALGPLAPKFRGRHEVRAFHGATESVLRLAKGEGGTVIVEGVNLAVSSARRDADALVSKLLRVMAGGIGPTKFIVGYLASPGGLNGEGHMRDWIREQVTPDVYDLNAEQVQFRERTQHLLMESNRERYLL